jgi:hypothetical protein
MTKEEILKKCKPLAEQGMNSTEMAQALAGGFSGDKYQTYVKILLTINDLKREGKL